MLWIKFTKLCIINTSIYKNYFFQSYLKDYWNIFYIVLVTITTVTTKPKQGEDIFTPTIRNVSLHEISSDNGVKIVNYATSKKSCQEYSVPTSQHS